MLKDTVITKKNAFLLVRLEPSLKRAILSRAKREGMSAAAIVRMAVRQFVKGK